MMNPMEMMKMKGMFEKFRANHPKVPMFFQKASTSIGVDSIIEITVTTAAGETLCTNMKVKPDDIELVEQLKKMASQK